MDQPGKVKVAILLVVSLTGKVMLRCPRSRLRSWPRETGSTVLSRAIPLILPTLNLVLTHGISPNFRGGVHLFIPPFGHAITFSVFERPGIDELFSRVDR